MKAYVFVLYTSHNVRNPTFGHVRPAKNLISLRISAAWLESLAGAFWIAKDAKFLHSNNEASDQTAQMGRLIWVFVGHTCQRIHFLTLRLIPYLAVYTLTTVVGLQSKLNSSNTDGSFTMANLNSYLRPNEILPITQENKYLGKLSYFIMKLYVVCTY